MDFEVMTHIGLPPEEVSDYISNLENLPTWDPAIPSSRKVTEGPVVADTRFVFRLEAIGLAGDVDIQVIERDRPRRFAWKAGPTPTKFGPVSPQLEVTLTPSGTGTKVRQDGQVNPVGAFRPVRRFPVWYGRQLWEGDFVSLRKLLEEPAGIGGRV